MSDEGYEFEDVKAHLLHEYQSGENHSEMLEQHETNSRTTADMSVFIMAVRGITLGWHGNYKGMFVGGLNGDDEINWETQLQRHYLNEDGYARTQHIEFRGALTRAEDVAIERKKKQGILSILGF